MKKKELFAALMATLAVTPVSADDLYQEVNLDREGRITKPHAVTEKAHGEATFTSAYGWQPTRPTKTVGTHSFNVDLVDQGDTNNFFGIYASHPWINEVPLNISVHETDRVFKKFESLVGLGVERAQVTLSEPVTVNVRANALQAGYAGGVLATSGSTLTFDNLLEVDVSLPRVHEDDQTASGQALAPSQLKVDIPFGVYAEEASHVTIKDLRLNFDTAHELPIKPQGLVASEGSILAVTRSADINVMNQPTPEHASAFFAFGGTVKLGTLEQPIQGQIHGDLVVESEYDQLAGHGSMVLSGKESTWVGMPIMLRARDEDTLTVGLINGASWTPVMKKVVESEQANSAERSKPLTTMYWAGNPVVALSNANREHGAHVEVDLRQAKSVVLKDDMTLKITSDLKHNTADRLMLPANFDGKGKVIHLMVMNDPSVVMIGDSVTASQPVEVVTNKGGALIQPEAVETFAQQTYDSPLEKGLLVADVDGHGDLVRVSLVGLHSDKDAGHTNEQTDEKPLQKGDDKADEKPVEKQDESSLGSVVAPTVEAPTEDVTGQTGTIDHVVPNDETMPDDVTTPQTVTQTTQKDRVVVLSDSALGAGEGLSAWRGLLRMTRSGWSLDDGTRLRGLWVDVSGAKVKDHQAHATFAGAKLGVDRDVSQKLSLGGFISMMHATGDLIYGTQKGDMAALGLRLGWYPDKVFVVSELGFGRGSTDLDLRNAQGQQVTGQVKGNSTWLSVVSGLKVLDSDFVSVTPKVGLSHTWTTSPTWTDSLGVTYRASSLDETEAWVGVASQLNVSDRLALKSDIRAIKAWGNEGTLTGTYRDQTQDIALQSMSGTRGLFKVGAVYQPRQHITVELQVGAETGHAWRRDVMGGLTVNCQW